MKGVESVKAVAIGIFILSALLILLYLLRKSNNIINMRNIFRAHFSLISKDFFTFVIFFFLPIAMGYACGFIQSVTKDIIDVVNIILPIYIGLQFSAAGILCGIERKNEQYEKIRENTFNEIMFQCILSVLALTLSVIITFVGIASMLDVILNGLSIVLYILIITIILNTFIVIKQIQFLFDER